ncbi:MAG: FAD-dependent oxidoreductase [Phycisphaerales bacterium]|nr:FAD-dependent oxidoreductase [Phycisphaerales bacterium]MCB9840501.1 FAD-dependent oxidoreductase [Phycisphaeraceae bacterium]
MAGRQATAQPADRPPPPGRVLIIGAGPTGLGAGYRLKELGHANFAIVDANPYAGGLAHSFTDDAGFTWDIGGHVMFSHYDYYDRVFEAMMGDEFTLNDRESWVRMCDRWVPYPFQNNIRYLPPEVAYECLSGLVKAKVARESGRWDDSSPCPGVAGAANFAELCRTIFGDGIMKHFMRPYNFKVWAHPPEMMNKQWIGERVAMIDVDRAIRNVVMGLDDFAWGPNNRFKFPLKGGTGAFYDRIAAHLGDRIQLGRRVVSIDVDARVATFADGSTERYDALISAMPLDVLCRGVLAGDVPDAIRDAAARLRHSAGYMVGIGIKRPCPSTKSWMYFPEDNCPFYRVTYLSNYSPFMTPDKDRCYSLLCETSQSDFKPVDADSIIDSTIRGLENAGLLEPGEREDIVTTWVYHAEYSYPTPTVNRDEILAQVIPWLEARGIYSRGRFGMWKYEVANTDHTLMQGVEAVDRLLLGTPETTIGIVYESTTDGRQAATHARPSVAGSGEKRLAAKAAAAAPAASQSVEPKPATTPSKTLSHQQAGDKPEVDVAEEELGVTQKP